MERVLLCLIGLFFVPETAKSESFSATVKLQQLPEQEKGLIKALDNYLKYAEIVSEESKASLERFLAQAQKANSAAEKDEFFSEKPINAFLLIRRLAEGWSHVTDPICGDEDDMNEEKFDYCQARDNVVRLSANWPSKEDLKGATSAMIRLADFYQLDFLDMANGVIKGINMMPLSIDDFNFIADSAVEENQEYLASIWYKKTLQVLEKMAPTDLSTKTRLQRKLASLYYKNGLLSKALKTIGEAIKDNPSHKGAKRDLALYRTRVPAENFAEPPRIPRPEFMVEGSVMSTYRRLCRGNMKSQTEMAKLHCRYRPTVVPFSPSKIEFANIDPPVVLFHELLSEKEMEHAKNTSAVYLQRSIVGDRRVESSIRISQTAWLGEMDDILLRMSRKVELHTGLSAMFSDSFSHAEPWQVLNYGIGGMYVPHEDSVASLIGKTDIPALVNSGDRMATFLFYLNDVTAGGATVFPYLKTRVPVVKGAAALWYNLLRNGTPDSRHLHAGCPVLVGSKWVSNKWIREIGQTFRRPCALDRNL